MNIRYSTFYAMAWTVAACLVAVTSAESSGGLSLIKQCGDRACKLDQYCSDGLCHDCSLVCQNGTHNFDRVVCETQCQDYIHDSLRHYITKEDLERATKDMKDSIKLLRVLLVVSFTIGCAFGIGFIGYVAFILHRKRRKIHQTKKMEKEMLECKMATVSAMYNNNKEADKSSGGLRLEMGSGAAVAPSVMTATTPVSTRHPSEDATLEYAYDNPTLTNSPPTPRALPT